MHIYITSNLRLLLRDETLNCVILTTQRLIKFQNGLLCGVAQPILSFILVSQVQPL